MFGRYGHAPQAAHDVAKAFYAGRTLKRSNCRTDGETYTLVNSIIARRYDLNLACLRTMRDEEHLQPAWTRLEFCLAGWNTDMTCRHLKALGLDIEWDFQRKASIDNRPVPSGWFTKDDVIDWPEYVPPPPVRTKYGAPVERFVNLTLPLFA